MPPKARQFVQQKLAPEPPSIAVSGMMIHDMELDEEPETDEPIGDEHNFGQEKIESMKTPWKKPSGVFSRNLLLEVVG